MNFCFLTRNFHPLPAAYKLHLSGHIVVVGMVEKEEAPDTPKAETEKRLSLYLGMLDIKPAKEVMAFLETVKDKHNWFLFFDYGDLWPYSEKALAMGFTGGIFPTEEGYTLEKDRKAGKEFAKKYFPKLKVAPVNEFKAIDGAVDFLNANDKVYVLKSEGSNAETVVPATEDPELGRNQIIGALEREQKDYERGGFTLEEKLKDAIEFSPIMLFWQGKPLFSLVEIENKPLGAGNIGRLTGGCQNLTMQTPLDCALNKMAFPPIIYEMAKKQPGIGVYDAGILHDGKDFCFSEFASQRFGFDGIYSEIAMCGGPSRHFDLIARGQNPLLYKYGCAVRMFQTQPDEKQPGIYKDGYLMAWPQAVDKQLYFYCIRKDRDEFVSVGYDKDLGVATGAGNAWQEAVNAAYKAATQVAMTGLYYRPQLDFESWAYPTAILRRYDWLMKSGLLDADKKPERRIGMPVETHA